MENKELLNAIREVSMLLSVYVKRGVSQMTLIKELSDAGFQPKRIAELIGTTPNNVRVALHKVKTNKRKK